MLDFKIHFSGYKFKLLISETTNNVGLMFSNCPEFLLNNVTRKMRCGGCSHSKVCKKIHYTGRFLSSSNNVFFNKYLSPTLSLINFDNRRGALRESHQEPDMFCGRPSPVQPVHVIAVDAWLRHVPLMNPTPSVTSSRCD